MINTLKKLFNPNSKKYWDEKYKNQEAEGILRSDGKSLEKFAHYFERASTIIDFGSGRGGNTLHLSKLLNHKKFILVDQSKVCLSQSRELLKAGNATNSYEFYEKLEDISNQQIAMIMSIEVLEHIPAYRDTLDKLWNLLQINGTLLISVPVKGWRDRHREHINKFTLKSMFEELSRYSEIVTISPRSYSKRSGILATAYFLIEKKNAIK